LNNETFFTLRAEFRGRLYVNYFFLKYQGSDLSKGLVKFAKGTKLRKKVKFIYKFMVLICIILIKLIMIIMQIGVISNI